MSNTTSSSTPRHRKRRRRVGMGDHNPPLIWRTFLKTECRFLILLSLVLLSSNRVISICGAFNLDTRIPIVKSGIGSGTLEDSYFGYSVAQHRTLRSKEFGESVILVGAPRDNNLQPNTNRSGALWQCRLTAAMNVRKFLFLISLVLIALNL